MGRGWPRVAGMRGLSSSWRRGHGGSGSSRRRWGRITQPITQHTRSRAGGAGGVVVPAVCRLPAPFPLITLPLAREPTPPHHRAASRLQRCSRVPAPYAAAVPFVQARHARAYAPADIARAHAPGMRPRTWRMHALPTPASCRACPVVHVCVWAGGLPPARQTSVPQKQAAAAEAARAPHPLTLTTPNCARL